ncbi:acetyltransferase [Alphaproteobacteria bacterium]|nr:acetyltransferase [Alphaproteobacteria bacterium]
MTYKKHPTSIIDKGAEIGDRTNIWHWTHICSGAKIGNSVTIGQNVFIANKVVIGDRCKIQNNVSIFDNVTLEEEVFCAPSVVFTNVYNPRSSIVRKDEYKNTTIKKGATLGANCTIICGITVGDFAFIGAGALVNKNVKPFSLMVGVPSFQKGWMSEYGNQIPLPLTGDGKYKCPYEGKVYKLRNNIMTRVK